MPCKTNFYKCFMYLLVPQDLDSLPNPLQVPPFFAALVTDLERYRTQEVHCSYFDHSPQTQLTKIYFTSMFI